MEISIGMLIIGSLVWDDQCSRSQWRKKRLDLASYRSVRAPIRYGRRSGTQRGNSYTMVFSQALVHEEEKSGSAIFVPCKQPVRMVEDLIEEAELLWAAEGNSDVSNGRISADWGCVALKVNPARPLPDDLCQNWALRVSHEAWYGNLDHTEDEEAIVEGAGLLNIPWPKCTDGSPLEVDALLATANNPTLCNGCYPSAEQIAAAWNTDLGRNHVQYFWKNKGNNIITFQDDEIESYLNCR
jgi:hypothetical protein